jgi:Sap-like sulfolipid-1-addressing protein
MGDVVVLAFTAALNPTELAATTVMLLLPGPEQLMFGYWLGAMTTGVASGLVIVFALQDTGAEHTTTRTVGPVAWLVVAALLLLAALVLAKGGGRRVREHRAARREQEREKKKTPRWQKTLQEGGARGAFVVGILLSFPGASYLAALDRLIHLHYSTWVTVLVVIGFNIVQNLLLEIPMLAFRIWPEGTPAAIEGGRAWVARNGQRYGAWALGLVGVALAIPSVIALVSG